MVVNKWRFVRYIDDGHNSFQCLKCKEFFTAASGPENPKWLYCPMCGSKWAGKHECKEQHDRIYASSVPSSRYWVIECRTIWGGVPQEWKQERALPLSWPAKQVYDMLKEMRDVEPDDVDWGRTLRFEYRVRIVSEVYSKWSEYHTRQW